MQSQSRQGAGGAAISGRETPDTLAPADQAKAGTPPPVRRFAARAVARDATLNGGPARTAGAPERSRSGSVAPEGAVSAMKSTTQVKTNA